MSRKSVLSILEQNSLICHRGDKFDLDLCKHLSPLGWEHIGLTGDYVWKLNNKEKT